MKNTILDPDYWLHYGKLTLADLESEAVDSNPQETLHQYEDAYGTLRWTDNMSRVVSGSKDGR